MYAEGVPEAGHADTPVQQGKVRGMEYAVTQAGHAGKQNQHRIILAGGQPECRHAEQGNAAEQHPQGAKTVHDETGERLADAGYDEKYAHQQAELRIADGEGLLQPGEQRGERKMEKMRSAMGKADQADDLGVAPE